MPNYVPGIGPLEPDLMIIGEAPGKNENLQKIPFVGASGEILNDCLRKASFSRTQAYVTNVVKYQPPFNDFKKLNLINVDLQKSIDELWKNEIAVYRPKCILAVGDEALHATTGERGILKYRGSILLAKDGVTKVVPTVHPAALFTRHTGGDEFDGEDGQVKGGLEFTYLKLIEHDIARAVEESRTSEYNIPYRDIIVARNSLDTHRYFSQYNDPLIHAPACDIESINCVPASISFAFRRDHAIAIPLLTKIGNHKLCDMTHTEMAEVWRQVAEVLWRFGLIGQNFKYDDFKLGLVGLAVRKVISDILIKTRVLFPELPDKKLHVISSIWTRQPYYKEDGKEFNYRKHPFDMLLKYNGMDSCVTKEVDEEQEHDLIGMAEQYKVPLVDYYYNYMMRKHKFYLKMENVGFLVDLERKAELNKKYTLLQESTHARLTALIGHEINVNSYPQKFELLYKEMRFKLRKKNPTAEDTIVAIMGNHCKGNTAKDKLNREILTVLLEEIRINTQKSRYINFKPDYDGRCKCSFNISATETCRSSTSSLKKPLRPTKSGGIPFHTISKHGRLAKDIRSMFIRDPGKILVQADASQCQARIVAVLAEDWSLLKAFDTVDIHRRTAGLMFGYTRDLILTAGEIPVVDSMDKDDPQRFCGKKVRHAGNFRMGRRRFMTELNTDAQKFDIKINVSEWRAGEMLEKFHKASPNLERVFWRQIEECIESTRTLIDPYGGVRVFNGRMGEELYKEGYANIPQRTEAHLVQQAALAVDDELNGDNAFLWISENHDSLLMEAPENNWEPYARLLKKHMERAIDFSVHCSLKRNYSLVIPCDIEISDTNYASLRKAKLS